MSDQSPTSRVGKLILIPIVVLIVAIALQLVPKAKVPHFSPPRPMSSLLPADIAGWSGLDTPLGETEFMEEVVRDVLRYDDAFYRVYRKSSAEVGVYAAYWKPGAINPTIAATHSPDLCWVNAGWREESHDYALVLPDGHGGELLETQFRVFSAGVSQRQEVVFWHLMGGRLSGYAMGPSKRWKQRLPVLLDNQFHNQFGRLQREQVFLRISTNRSIAELVEDPFWAELTAALGATGIEPVVDDETARAAGSARALAGATVTAGSHP